jgi:hypothetical protein
LSHTLLIVLIFISPKLSLMPSTAEK